MKTKANMPSSGIIHYTVEGIVVSSDDGSLSKVLDVFNCRLNFISV